MVVTNKTKKANKATMKQANKAKNKPNLNGKTVLLTGATGTIGQAILEHLLTLGAQVLVTVRKKENMSLFCHLQEKHPNSVVRVMELDVSRFASIEHFVKELKEQNLVIDHVIHNAGVYRLPTRNTADGYEIHYATNFLGPMYFTLLLLPLLSKNAHVVYQTSISSNKAQVNWNNVQQYGQTNKIKVYANTKKLLNLAVMALQQQVKQPVEFVLAHPGVCATNILSYKNGGYSKWFSLLATGVLKVACHSPKTAALGVVNGLFAHKTKGYWLAPRGLGQVWGKPTKKPMHPSHTKQEVEKAKELLVSELGNKVPNLKTLLG